MRPFVRALVNALIHADYLGEGGVVIEKYKDRFEFSNPGSLTYLHLIDYPTGEHQ